MGRIYKVCYRNGGKFKWGFFPGILPKSAHFSQGTTASSFFDEITRLFSFFITSMSWRAWGGSLVMEFFSPWRASLELWSFETSCAAFIDFYPVFRSQTTFILQLFILQRPFHSTTTGWARSCSTDASFDLMQVRILWISLIFTLWWILLYFSKFSGTKVVQLNDDKLLLSCSYPAIMEFANIWFARVCMGRKEGHIQGDTLELWIPILSVLFLWKGLLPHPSQFFSRRDKSLKAIIIHVCLQSAFVRTPTDGGPFNHGFRQHLVRSRENIVSVNNNNYGRKEEKIILKK